MSKRSSRSGLVAIMIHGGGPNDNTLTISQSTPQDSGTFLYANYTLTGGTENNRPPWVISNVVTGTVKEGQTLTITCVWDRQGSGAIGTPSLKVYKQASKNTISGGNVTRTLLATKTDGSNSSIGNIVTTTYTYDVQSTDVGNYLSFDFVGNVVGVANVNSDILSSDLTVVVAANLPAIYTTLSPEFLLLKGDYDATNNIWTDKGTTGGSWSVAGTNPTKQSGGEITFAGAGNLTKAISNASADANYNIWMKFKSSSLAAIVTFFEMSTNRRGEILTSGAFRLRSTTQVSTSGVILVNTIYNVVMEHKTDASYYIRVEKNDGTLVLEETLASTGANGINSGTGALFATAANASRMSGDIHEFGCKFGTTTSQNKTDILTRLKSI